VTINNKLNVMKTKLIRNEFIPFTLQVNVETHAEFKALYKVAFENGNLNNLTSILIKYSSDNKVSV